MRVRFTTGARDQLRGISQYIGERNPAATEQVGQRLRTVIDRLAERPAIGAPGRVPNTREFKVPGLPYRITYRVRQDDGPVLEILRLHHEAQSDVPPDWT